MGVILMAMLGVAVEEPSVIWIDAFEMRDRGIQVQEAGDYTVWLWADTARPVSGTLGEIRLKITRKRRGKDEEYEWVKAGKAELAAGRVEVTLEGKVAALALSTNDVFDPAKAMGHMRVSQQPDPPADGRAGIQRDTDTVFAMTEFASREAWEEYAEGLRRRILISSGLWPLPKRTALNPHVEVVAEHADYIVEKVYFESRPGVLVTGNLYRPPGDGPFPGVACPHGHWKTGRLEDTELGCIAARCITFARMGMAAFSYDMVGYVDSLQFPDHGWVDDREFLWGIHSFAFQLWNSMRVVDFLESLPYVDGENLACTGASGGGTQTFALMAVEPRIKAAAPVNMISHTMQGGCTCENAPLLRFDASNMEIGALMAPRPLMMVSATGDWTKKTPEVEYPAIRGIFDLYGAADRVASQQIDAPHNYNKASREAVYRFFGKWVLNEGEKYADSTEPAYAMEPLEALRVFPDGKLPEGFATKDDLIPGIIEATRGKWAAILPKSAGEAAAFRAEYGVALAQALGAKIPGSGDVAARQVSSKRYQGYTLERLIVRRPVALEEIPALLYRPENPRGGSVLLVHGKGKAALADIESGGPGALVKGLLEQGKTVLAIDTFLTGEHQEPLKGTKRRRDKFPDTFLPSDTAYRVQDILTASAYLRAYETAPSAIAGLGEAGMWALFAAALDPETPEVLCDANGFDPGDDAAWIARHYVPCIRAIGDVHTAAACLAPREVAVMNCPKTPAWQGFAATYANARGKAGAVVYNHAFSPAEIVSRVK